jgi:uncharacterized protein YkwD
LSATPSARAASHAAARASLLEAVNAARTGHGLRPLRLDARLDRVAETHTRDMLAHDYFGHGDFDGRLAALELHGSFGENLAWGTGRYTQARAIVQMWLTSAEHRANLLRPGFSRIGFGVATGPFQGGRRVLVVTADFGG